MPLGNRQTLATRAFSFFRLPSSSCRGLSSSLPLAERRPLAPHLPASSLSSVFPVLFPPPAAPLITGSPTSSLPSPGSPTSSLPSPGSPTSSLPSLDRTPSPASSFSSPSVSSPVPTSSGASHHRIAHLQPSIARITHLQPSIAGSPTSSRLLLLLLTVSLISSSELLPSPDLPFFCFESRNCIFWAFFGPFSFIENF